MVETHAPIDLTDSASTADRLQDLQQLGARLAIDDLGTGYSSRAYLRRFRIDSLKIDRSFVAAITRMADELGLGVVTEGVRRAARRDRLAELGRRVFQGYLFGRATPRILPAVQQLTMGHATT